MRWICTVLLAGCGSSTPTPAPAKTAPPPDAAAVVTVDAAPPDAAVDSELAAAPASVFRFYSTGQVPMKDGPRLETWTLRRVGDRASIQVDAMRQTGDAWELARTMLFTGTATDDGTTSSFTLASGANKLALACKRDKLAVAAANAIRKPSAKKPGQCNGDPGKWSPDRTKQLAVLSCKHPDYEVPMPFAPAPGVEYLYVNDDCVMQGGGYRAIAADAAVAPVR